MSDVVVAALITTIGGIITASIAQSHKGRNDWPVFLAYVLESFPCHGKRFPNTCLLIQITPPSTPPVVSVALTLFSQKIDKSTAMAKTENQNAMNQNANLRILIR